MITTEKLPNVLQLKWKNCEKSPPKYSDYYVVKFDLKKYQWYLSYYVAKENKFLLYTTDYSWQFWNPQPWMWAPLPRIEHENTLFDLGEYSEQ